MQAPHPQFLTLRSGSSSSAVAAAVTPHSAKQLEDIAMQMRAGVRVADRSGPSWLVTAAGTLSADTRRAVLCSPGRIG